MKIFPITAAAFRAMRPAKRAKYGNRATVVDGIRFASAHEARRYGELTLLARANVIRDLRLQVRYPLIVNGTLVCTYVADFVYRRDGAEYIEDAKGVRTKEYIIKFNLMRAVYGITIQEV